MQQDAFTHNQVDLVGISMDAFQKIRIAGIVLTERIKDAQASGDASQVDRLLMLKLMNNQRKAQHVSIIRPGSGKTASA